MIKKMTLTTASGFNLKGLMMREILNAEVSLKFWQYLIDGIGWMILGAIIYAFIF
jgi:hypothetical protein